MTPGYSESQAYVLKYARHYADGGRFKYRDLTRFANAELKSGEYWLQTALDILVHKGLLAVDKPRGIYWLIWR